MEFASTKHRIGLEAQELLLNETDLKARLSALEITPLLMAMVQLGGPAELLDAAQPYIKGPWNYRQLVPQELRLKIVDAMLTVMREYAEAKRTSAPSIAESVIRKMMSVAAGEEIPDEYVPMMKADLAIESNGDVAPLAATERRLKVLVVGAGMSGILAAIKLAESGDDFLVIEKYKDVGGTWLEATYPGCGVDTPSHFYQYSFRPNNRWPHYFAKQRYIQNYFANVVDHYGLRQRIRFQTEMVSAAFDEQLGLWRVVTRKSDGTYDNHEVDALIMASGLLGEPSIPNIPGLESFAGPVLHTARWDNSVQLAGKRVAVIGTGASAMQLAPSIAPAVSQLTVVQRTPHWIVPNPNYHAPVSELMQWAFEHLPFFGSWYRFTLFWGFGDGLYQSLLVDPNWPGDLKRSINVRNERHRRYMLQYLESQLAGREDLIRKAIPDYPPYGKRILIDNHWYEMLKRENVQLLTGNVDAIEEDAIVVNGERHKVDIIALATGYNATKMLSTAHITGIDGKSIRELWKDDDPRAYLGITVPAFPNMFIIAGPNTFLGHGGSMIFNSECQMRYIHNCLALLRSGTNVTMEVRQDAHDDYNCKVDARLKRLLWSQDTVNNWYKTRNGRVVALLPWRLVDYWNWTLAPNVSDYRISGNINAALLSRAERPVGDAPESDDWGHNAEVTS